MKITILGSGAWQGIPIPFCNCEICREAIKNPYSRNARSRPGLMIENESDTFLLEVSPDIRIQSTRFNIPQIDNFIVSHWHFDHMYGLHELLTWMKNLDKKPTIHCSLATKEKIDSEFSYLPMDVNVLDPYKKFVLHNFSITPLPLYHMFSVDDQVSENELNNTFGYLLEYNNKRIVYLADYYRLPKKVLKIIEGADVLIADGTYLFTEEYKKIKKNHIHGQDILDFVANTNAKVVYFHSISHLTKLAHEQLQKKLPAECNISYDGLEIIL